MGNSIAKNDFGHNFEFHSNGFRLGLFVLVHVARCGVTLPPSCTLISCYSKQNTKHPVGTMPRISSIRRIVIGAKLKMRLAWLWWMLKINVEIQAPNLRIHQKFTSKYHMEHTQVRSFDENWINGHRSLHYSVVLCHQKLPIFTKKQKNRKSLF